MRRHVKTVHADFKDDETIDDSESPENVDDEDSNKADCNDSSIQGDTDDDGDDDDEVGWRRRKKMVKKRIQMTRGVY